MQKKLDTYRFLVLYLGEMRKKETMNDLEFFDTITKKVPWSKTTTPILKTVYSRPKFVETPRVLTYKLTGEKYKVMRVVPGGFEKIKVGEVKEMEQTWKDEDVLDKIFVKLAKKGKK